ncbi:MAG: glycosyltransferase [Bacteroidota bacterium]|nr:glycosyltransferase [Bacteroidota bacterium]
MSKIRFLKITSNYPAYIDHMVKVHPIFSSITYSEVLEDYFYDAYGWADFWKINLEATGKFECGEVIMNAEFLQKKWAAENKVKYSETDWKNEIVIEQIKVFKPDVLFLVDQYNDNSLSLKIKQQVPSIKLLLGWDGILWHKPKTYEHMDVILTPVKETMSFYSDKKMYFHKFGFEENVLKRLKKNNDPYETSFTGSIIPHPDYHLSRLHLIADLSRKVDMNLWIGSFTAAPMGPLTAIVKRQWKFYSSIQQIRNKNKGEAYGLNMFNILYNSKIVFNSHGDNSPKYAANMRMTEVTGTGALLLTDWKENIGEFFKPDEEIITYKTVGEALDKIKMLLKNDNLRKTIAANGHKRTLTEYSYKERMKELGNFITSII